jgi:hypothetical protein
MIVYSGRVIRVLREERREKREERREKHGGGRRELVFVCEEEGNYFSVWLFIFFEMLKRIQIIFPGIACLFLFFNLWGCFRLEEELLDKVAPEAFFQDEKGLITVAGRVYPTLYPFMGPATIFAIQEVSSDEMIVPARGSDWYENGHWRRLHTHEYNCYDQTINSVWQFLFQGINECDRILTLLAEAEADVDETSPYKAEIRMLRAFYYYWLLDLFGNVPIVPEDVFQNDPSNYQPVTSPRSQVYEYVEAQILAQLPHLERHPEPETYGRVHYYMAQSLLASLYLNAEVYTGEPQWEKAIAACDEVINSGLYDLSVNYFDNFKTQNEGSVENIFVIPYDRTYAPGFNVHMMTLHYQSQRTYDLQSQPWNGFCSLQEFYESYDSADVRRDNFIVGPQYDREGNPLLDFGASDQDPDGMPIHYTPEMQGAWPGHDSSIAGALRQEGARIGKYEIEIGASQDLDNDFPIYRFAEILLHKAEALWRLDPGDPQALDLVNQIRERAGVAPLAALTGENLLAERGREMAFEAKRRTDLIRFGVYGEPWQFKSASEPCKSIFPLPCAMLQAGSNLQQNPCY